MHCGGLVCIYRLIIPTIHLTSFWKIINLKHEKSSTWLNSNITWQHLGRKKNQKNITYFWLKISRKIHLFAVDFSLLVIQFKCQVGTESVFLICISDKILVQITNLLWNMKYGWSKLIKPDIAHNEKSIFSTLQYHVRSNTLVKKYIYDS